MKKIPTQQRARQTVEDIFEATAQLLDAEASDTLTTNRIAERAGISIGTLYNYFPNKASLLRAMALVEMRRHETRLNEQIDAARGEEIAGLVRAMVRQVMTAFGGRLRVRRHILALVGHDPTVQRASLQTVDRITDRFLASLGIDPDEVTRAYRFLLLRSALGPIRAAVMQEPQLLTPDFEDELVRLTLALTAQVGGLSRSREAERG